MDISFERHELERHRDVVEHWNDDPQPFIWHKTADDIIAKVRRGRAVLAQVKSATHD